MQSLDEPPPLYNFCISANSFLHWLVSAAKISILGKKLKFVATTWIFYNFQIHKRIVSAETICGNTVFAVQMLKPSDKPNSSLNRLNIFVNGGIFL